MARLKNEKRTKKAEPTANASPALRVTNKDLPPHSDSGPSCPRCEEMLFVITGPGKSDKPLSFLELPLELRNDIYDRVLPQEQHYELLPDLRVQPRSGPRRYLTSLSSSEDSTLPPFPDLLLVNRQINDEAARLYYANNSLHIVEHVTIKQLNATPARIKRVAALLSSSLKHTKKYKLQLWILPDERLPDQALCLKCVGTEISTGVIVEFKDNKLSGKTFQIEESCSCGEIMAGRRLKRCAAVYNVFKKVFAERERGVQVDAAMGHDGAVDYGDLVESIV